MNKPDAPAYSNRKCQNPCLGPALAKPFAGLLAVSLALACGCGQKATYQTKEGEVKIDQKAGQTTYEATTKDGKLKVSAGQAGVALPDGFPKDVPIYKGATVSMAMSQGKQMVVHLTVSASPADGIKYYQDELKANGWAIESTMNMGEMSMVNAKKEQRKCAVVAHKQDKGSWIQLAVEPGAP